MPESEQRAPAIPATSHRGRRSLWQWNIATLLLLMAAVSVWTSYFRLTSETRRMDADLDTLRQLSRELVIEDPDQFAIVKRIGEWHDDDSWNVFVPEGGRYVLKLATRRIVIRMWVQGVPRDDLPDTDHVVEIAPGRHVIAIEKHFQGKQPSAGVRVDGKLVLEVMESDDWTPQAGYSTDGYFATSVQSPTDMPLEVTRIRFHQQQPTGAVDGLYNGLLLWIERRE